MKLKCPNCGYNLKYRISNHDAFCESCNSSIDINQLTYEPNTINNYSCDSCGATLKTIDENTTIICSYCGSKNFTKNILKFDYKPIGILPFLYEKNIFKEKVIEYLKTKKAKNMIKRIKKTEVFGVYLPYSYQYNFFNEKTINTQNEFSSKKSKIVSDLGSFSNIKSLAEILPYDLKKAEIFNPIYLDNFVAYDVQQKFINDTFNTRKPEFYWVPVWIIKTGLNGDIFMNAQTGEVAGYFYSLDGLLFLTNKKSQIGLLILFQLLFILIFIIFLFMTINKSIDLLSGTILMCADFLVNLIVISMIDCIDFEKYIKRFHFRID